jgi:hypothetical protein
MRHRWEERGDQGALKYTSGSISPSAPRAPQGTAKSPLLSALIPGPRCCEQTEAAASEKVWSTLLCNSSYQNTPNSQLNPFKMGTRQRQAPDSSSPQASNDEIWT